MVLLGGLEVVAAGYLINKHYKTKRERERLEDERHARRRHHRSHSEGRYSESDDDRSSDDDRYSQHRRHSRDRKHRHEHHRPASTSPVPPRYQGHAPPGRPASQPLPPQPAPQNMSQPAARPSPRPQDVKYGWSDAGSSSSQQQQDIYPPTGWPAHWPQSQIPENINGGSQNQHLAPGPSRGRSPTRPRANSGSRVRFALPEGRRQPGERSRSRSPPPRYRP